LLDPSHAKKLGFSDGLQRIKQMKLAIFIMKDNLQSVFQSMLKIP